MSVAQLSPTPHDRLSLTLSIALLIHALIVFGINFTKEDRPTTRSNTMEIVLVKQETKAPEESDILAQKNLQGGGEIEEVIEPATSIAPSFSESNQQIIDQPTLNEELFQPHDIEISKTEILEVLDINKESMEAIVIENMENEITARETEKQVTDIVY